MPVDPVCEMHVEEEKAAATSEYEGKTYYFCSSGCKRRFEQDPGKFLAHLRDDEGQAQRR